CQSIRVRRHQVSDLLRRVPVLLRRRRKLIELLLREVALTAPNQFRQRIAQHIELFPSLRHRRRQLCERERIRTPSVERRRRIRTQQRIERRLKVVDAARTLSQTREHTVEILVQEKLRRLLGGLRAIPHHPHSLSGLRGGCSKPV